MAKNQDTPETQISPDASVSLTDLIKLLGVIQKDSNSALASTLATELAKLQPGYKSPEVKKYEEQLQADQRSIIINQLKRKRLQQRNCPHEVGQTGNKRNGEGAFCGLKLSTGEMIGVCQYCQMVISSANPEHQRFFHKLNGTPAESGQASGLADPIKAQLARLSPDQRERVLKSREKYFATENAKELLEDEELV